VAKRRRRGQNPEDPPDSESQPPSGFIPILVLVSGEDDDERTFVLEAEQTRIGRSPDSDIPISDRSVSRFHAEVLRQGDDFRLVHKSTVNPTLLNGLSLDDSTLLVD